MGCVRIARTITGRSKIVGLVVLDAGAVTQVWLATSNDPEAMVSGQYFYHQKRRAAEPAAVMARGQQARQRVDGHRAPGVERRAQIERRIGQPDLAAVEHLEHGLHRDGREVGGRPGRPRG